MKRWMKSNLTQNRDIPAWIRGRKLLGEISFFLLLFIDTILPRRQRQTLGHWEAFCLSSSVHVLPLDVTTPRDSYAWNCRELATLLALSESLAEVGFEPLTIRSMRKNLTTEPHKSSCIRQHGMDRKSGLIERCNLETGLKSIKTYRNLAPLSTTNNQSWNI